MIKERTCKKPAWTKAAGGVGPGGAEKYACCKALKEQAGIRQQTRKMTQRQRMRTSTCKMGSKLLSSIGGTCLAVSRAEGLLTRRFEIKSRPSSETALKIVWGRIWNKAARSKKNYTYIYIFSSDPTSLPLAQALVKMHARSKVTHSFTLNGLAGIGLIET